MAKKKIKPGDFAAAVDDILKKYGDEVFQVLGDSVQTIADESVQKLKAVRNSSDWGHPWDEYSSSWTSTKEYKGRLEQVTVIHNADHYRLTHLLEFGHVKQNGGRTRAFPHIAPVNDWASEELPKLVGRKLG